MTTDETMTPQTGFTDAQRAACDVYSGALAAGLVAAVPEFGGDGAACYVQVPLCAGAGPVALVYEPIPGTGFEVAPLIAEVDGALGGVGAAWGAALGTDHDVRGALVGCMRPQPGVTGSAERSVLLLAGESVLLEPAALAAELTAQMTRARIGGIDPLKAGFNH